MKPEHSELITNLSSWDAAQSAERNACAMAVAKTLPESFTLKGLERHSLGNQSHEIAFFDHGGFSFALLPGNPSAVLGYDRSEPFELSAAQSKDWQQVEDEYECPFHKYLDEYLSPLRRVAIAPFLIEAVAREFEYAQDGDDQREGYAKILSDCLPEFRLPTADEWEYACAAGTRSLFRWGNECPVTNSYHEEEWDRHKQPNAFGLRMNTSTYDSELCDGPTIRGGDGGGSVCGGIGNLITWIPFASAFQVTDEEVQYWWIDDVYVRRVRSITA